LPPGNGVSLEPFRDAATPEHLVDGCRKAGLPERRAIMTSQTAIIENRPSSKMMPDSGMQ
jgi:hypothetical protein